MQLVGFGFSIAGNGVFNDDLKGIRPFFVVLMYGEGIKGVFNFGST